MDSCQRTTTGLWITEGLCVTVQLASPDSLEHQGCDSVLSRGVVQEQSK